MKVKHVGVDIWKTLCKTTFGAPDINFPNKSQFTLISLSREEQLLKQ